MKQRAFSLFGSLALVNFPYETIKKDKIKFANEILKNNQTVKTVLEKLGKFKGRLRKQQTNFLAGIKTKEVLYKENGCTFRFNIDETYFSPRLSNERNEIAKLVKKNEEVLVSFAGVGPFSIVIAKNSHVKKVYSNELNRMANKYAQENIIRNKLQEKVEIISGDFKKVAKKLVEHRKKFDVIVMPRPQLKDSFLSEALSLSKKGTRVYYYDFCKMEEVKSKVKMVEKIAEKNKKKIKILRVKHAGEIAPFKVRIRIDFEVMN
ncbi:MAG: 50S ribosomal protein L11 methyltransferase [DPANN group archaeon]|nr:50S ribosomal protein L11 methyltransferase [DPANN group archaeon]